MLKAPLLHKHGIGAEWCGPQREIALDPNELFSSQRGVQMFNAKAAGWLGGERKDAYEVTFVIPVRIFSVYLFSSWAPKRSVRGYQAC